MESIKPNGKTGKRQNGKGENQTQEQESQTKEP
jgi:hypothetical protein